MVKPQNNVASVLLASPQVLTGSWVDLSDVIDVRDIRSMALWLGVDINDSLNVRVRILADVSEAFANAHILPLGLSPSYSVDVTQEFAELGSDTDQHVVLPFDVLDLAPFVKFQVQAGTAGVAPGDITSAQLTISERSPRHG